MLVAEILKTKGDAVYAIGPDLALGEACGELDRRGGGSPRGLGSPCFRLHRRRAADRTVGGTVRLTADVI